MVVIHDERNSDHGKTRKTNEVMNAHTEKMIIDSRVTKSLLKGSCWVDVFTAQILKERASAHKVCDESVRLCDKNTSHLKP